MNERIKELKKQAWDYAMAVHDGHIVPPLDKEVWPIDKVLDEKFAELLVSDVLREVDTRAYVSGDRAWSDDLDRPWIELEYGFGTLADAQRQAGKRK
jgi:hypothetical protein